MHTAGVSSHILCLLFVTTQLLFADDSVTTCLQTSCSPALRSLPEACGYLRKGI